MPDPLKIEITIRFGATCVPGQRERWIVTMRSERWTEEVMADSVEQAMSRAYFQLTERVARQNDTNSQDR